MSLIVENFVGRIREAKDLARPGNYDYYNRIRDRAYPEIVHFSFCDNKGTPGSLVLPSTETQLYASPLMAEENDIKFICLASNNVLRLAEALEIAVKALEGSTGSNQASVNLAIKEIEELLCD